MLKSVHAKLTELEDAPLGKNSVYITQYSPHLLYPISRQAQRESLNITSPLPFKGFDSWTAYELTWLNPKGKPMVAIAQIDFPYDSPNMIESKSLKLYLNSFSSSKFSSAETVQSQIQQDLSNAADRTIDVTLYNLSDFAGLKLQNIKGTCIDDLDITVNSYEPDPSCLSIVTNSVVEETLLSDLLKSNCPVTGQPDFASLQITYRGAQLSRTGLLKYIISLRDCTEFHEHCVERIFMDIMQQCEPQSLTVQARYTRRGGLDINPIRSTQAVKPISMVRMVRQ